MPSASALGFGPFRLDLRTKQLRRDGTLVTLTPTQIDILIALVTHAGELVTKEDLIKAGWPDVIVADNTLTKAIVDIRAALGDGDSTRYIETLARRGYRFTAKVTASVARHTDEDIDALIAPHRALIEGRAALEALDREAMKRARVVFDRLVRDYPDNAVCRVGLANAYVQQFESTRADLRPDVEALHAALQHIREAARLDLHYAEAFATLGFVLERIGRTEDALAALHRAVTIDPHVWEHQLRYAYVGWGEHRLRAARRTIALSSNCPPAHWLIATVLVARGDLAAAEREVDAGLAAASTAPATPARLLPVALHLLKGLLQLARGDDEAALESFKSELALEPRGHLYARELAGNTWYAIGAMRLRRGEPDDARATFAEALAHVPGHSLARVGLSIVDGANPATSSPGQRIGTPDLNDAMAAAAWHLARNEAAAAARLVGDALAAAPAGSAGWILPIEPLLGVQAARDTWAPVLDTLRARAI
jgi:DNA-binding winged helix-turn-helix (wHTH) protein